MRWLLSALKSRLKGGLVVEVLTREVHEYPYQDS